MLYIDGERKDEKAQWPNKAISSETQGREGIGSEE